MNRPQKIFEPYPDPQNQPIRTQNVKNDPKIKSKSKARMTQNNVPINNLVINLLPLKQMFSGKQCATFGIFSETFIYKLLILIFFRFITVTKNISHTDSILLFVLKYSFHSDTLFLSSFHTERLYSLTFVTLLIKRLLSVKTDNIFLAKILSLILSY